MSLKLSPQVCPKGEALPLIPLEYSSFYSGPAHTCPSPLPALAMGVKLCDSKAKALFQVAGQIYLPQIPFPLPLLLSLETCSDPAGPLELDLDKSGWALAVITLSDKGWQGLRQDRSGPALSQMLGQALPLRHSQNFLLPDDPRRLRALVLDLAFNQGYDLILCSGGTGAAPRDLSPEALLPILERRFQGLEQQMILSSLSKSPNAALSRLLAGSLASCLLVALPGSVKGACENMEAILPALPHALAKLHDDPADCGG